MKILHVLDSLNAETGGVAVAVSRLADHQAAHGAEPAIFAHDYEGLGPALAVPRVRCVLLPATRLPFRLGARSQDFSSRLAAEIQLADIVHVHGCWLPTNIKACRAARQARKPYIVSPRGMLESWSLRHRALRKRLVWRLWEHTSLRLANGLHATADAEAARLRALGLRAPIAVAPDAVELPRESGDRAVLEEKFPELKGRRWLLFLSRMHAKKGLDMLIDAWADLCPASPDWRLVIAGSAMDGEDAAYREHIARRGISERTTFIGHVEGREKSAAFAGADLFVLPTHSENFGIVVAEALAHGVPVITTTGAPWEILRESRSGWWIEPALRALSDALREAFALDPAALRAMGGRGVALVEADFCWKVNARKLLTFYEWILDPARADRPEFVMP